jgi:hypothetical protein
MVCVPAARARPAREPDGRVVKSKEAKARAGRKREESEMFLRDGLADGFADGNLPHGTSGTIRGASPRGPLGIFGGTLDAIWFSIHEQERPVGSRLGSPSCRGRGCDARAKGIYSLAFLRPAHLFLPLTRTFRGVTNRRKASSLVVSLLTNCKVQSRVRPQTCLAGQAC